MNYINHRVNTVEKLKKTPISNGIEVDLRYHNNELILHHDPFHHHENIPEKFIDLLKEWNHTGPMILNVKTEGIEQHCIDLMTQYKIKDWFFLDLSMPYFAIYSEKAFNDPSSSFSKNNLAVRFSEREPIEYALSYKNKVKWVWIDCFSILPLTEETYLKLKNSHFKICLVSPELQNHPIERITDFVQQISTFKIDAVCTKYPHIWKKEIEFKTY